MRLLILCAVLVPSCAGMHYANRSPELLAEIEFMFPSQVAELRQAMLRTELATLRADELGIIVEDAAVDSTLNSMVEQISASATTDLDQWAQQEHQAPWSQVEASYRRHIRGNLLYQQVYYADGANSKNYQVMLLANSQQRVVETWADALELGQHPEGLGAVKDYIWLPLDSDLTPGSLIGPLRMANGVWLLARIMAESEPKISSEISPFATEVWIREMSSRYNIGQ